MEKKLVQHAGRAIAAVAGAMTLTAAHAVENGAPITPIGVFDFGAGQLPPPTPMGTVGLRAAAARAAQARDNGGDASPAVPHLKVDSYSVAFIKTTDTVIGGARFGWGLVVPYLDMSLDLSVPTPAGPLVLSGRDHAAGDVMLMPLMLQWAPSPGLFTNVQLGVQAPTGAYDKNRLVNAGTNHWTLVPSFAFTSISPGGFEISSNIQLNFNTTNKDTHYRSGTEYQQEFALGQHAGAWTFGLGGYWYRQLTDDSAPNLPNGNRSRVAAIGPALSFFELRPGLPAVWAHVYKEFDARNRTQGTQFAIRAAWSF